MLLVLFAQDCKVEDLSWGATSGFEPSLFFSNYLFGLGFKPVQDDLNNYLGHPAKLNMFCSYIINSSTYTTLVKTMYTACVGSYEVKI